MPPTVLPWLTLKLALVEVHEGVGNLLLVKIGFVNASTDVQQLTFTNRRAKTELLGLDVIDRSGSRLQPFNGLMIRPLSEPADPPRSLQPGEIWWYELPGEIVGDTLRFTGAHYQLKLGERYSLRFRYAGAVSPFLAWSFVGDKHRGA